MTLNAADVYASFAPVCDRRCRVLVLGSLPGVQSAAMGRYYAHPRNHFWPIIGHILGENFAELSYGERLDRLVERRVGLWDSVQSASRHRSNDATIARNAKLNPLDALVAKLPDLRLIAFNGKTAARLGQRVLREGLAVPMLVLPSTSPANTLPFEAKLASWRAISDTLSDGMPVSAEGSNLAVEGFATA